MGKTVELEDRDFAFVMKMNKQVDDLGNVTGYAPTMSVYVGDKQVGLITSISIRAATSSVTPDVEVELAGGLSYEDAKSMPDSTKESMRDYARLLGLVPGVKVKSPLT